MSSKNKVNITIYTACIFMLLYSMYDINIFIQLSVISIILSVIVNKAEENIKIAFFLVPCIDLFLKEGMFSYGIIIYLVIAIHYFITRINKIKTSYFNMLCLMLIIIMEIMKYYNYTNNEIISSCRWMIIFTYGICINADKNFINDFKQNICVFYIGTIYSVILGFLVGSQNSFYTNSEKIGRLQGVSGDPNWLSMICTILILSILNIMVKENKITKKYIFMTISLIIIGIGTLSRTYILINILIVSIVFMNSIIKYNPKIIKGIIVGFIVLMVIIITIPEIKVYTITMIERISFAGNMEDFTGYRSTIQHEYISTINSSTVNFLKGYGITGYMRNMKMDSGPHNTYIEIISAWGIIGFIIFISLIISLIINEKYNLSKRIDIYSILPIIAMGLFIIALQSVAKATSVFIIYIAIKNISYSDEKKYR